MRQARKRVGLLHELRELAGAEELANRGDDRANVDEADGRRRLIAQAHALLDDALHAQQADAQLGLHQLAHGFHTAIAQVIHVIRLSRAVVNLDDAAHQGDNIFFGDGAHGHGHRQAHALIQFVTANALQVVALLIKNLGNEILAGVIQRRGITGPHAAVEFDERLLGQGVVATHFPGRLLADCGRDPGMIGSVIHVAKELEQLVICTLGQKRAAQLILHSGQGAQKDGQGHRALAVEAQGQVARTARLELHPRAAIRDELGVTEAAHAVFIHAEVDARRADELADDDALGPVDDEGRILGHERNVAQEDFLFDNLIVLTIDQGDFDVEGDCVSEIALKALFLRVLGFAKTIGKVKPRLLRGTPRQVQAELTVVAFDWRNFVKQIAQPFFQQPAIGLQLHFHQARQRQGAVDTGV